jgi:hypothetical protein
LSNEEDSISSRESMNADYLENDEEMDSPLSSHYHLNNCHQIPSGSPPHQTMMNEEELSSVNNDVLSDDGTFENIVEYAVLLPDSFVVLD